MSDTARIKHIFNEALELPATGERQAYVDRACGLDENLRKRVVELLDATTSIDSSFMEKSPAVPKQKSENS